MVSARWQLDQSVKKALVDSRPLNESMLRLQEELAQEIRAASVLRKKHTVKLVDRKGSACDPSKATHAGVVQSPRVFCMMLRGCLSKPEVFGP